MRTEKVEYIVTTDRDKDVEDDEWDTRQVLHHGMEKYKHELIQMNREWGLWWQMNTNASSLQGTWTRQVSWGILYLDCCTCSTGIILRINVTSKQASNGII